MLKRFTLLSLLLLPFIFASHAQCKQSPREVWVTTSNYGDPTALLTALQNCLKRHPQSDRFHIQWGMAAPHEANGGTLIYDRKRQVVWLFQDNNYTVPEDEDAEHPIYKTSGTSQQWRFSRVTPHRLRLLFQKYGDIKRDKGFGDAAYDVSFFPHLTEFGARGGLISHTSTSSREKIVNGKWVRVQ